MIKNKATMDRKYICKKLTVGPIKKERCFTPLELENLPYIDPLFFLNFYFRKRELFGFKEKDLKLYCFNTLQNIFHKILKRFLGVSNNSFKDYIRKELHEYSVFKEIILHDSYCTHFDNRNLDKLSPADLVISLYKELSSFRDKLGIDTHRVEVCVGDKFRYEKLKKNGWQYSVLEFLRKRASKKLSPFIRCFLVHGSFASKDFIEDWSDLDTIMILNDNIFRNKEHLQLAKKDLLKLSLLCHRVDPLAHHRFVFLTDLDLNYYPSFIFPPVLYDYALLLFGSQKINLNLRSDSYQKIQIMSGFVNYFRDKILSGEYSRNKFQWKNDIAHITLWPSFLLQAKGIYIYKKHSFHKVKEEFPQIDFGIIDSVTKIMENWSRPNILKYYPNFLFTLLPFYINQKIINQYIKYLKILPLSQSPKEIEKYTREILELLEKSFSLVLEDLKK